ncbi:MAG: diaminopimelate epimerase [Campylobacteraceae bacterium]
MKFEKYSASGNDFIIFHSEKKEDRSKLAIELCDRHNGIGADGLIVVVPNSNYDFEWQFYNSDGSSANMCGNGSRACAHYAFKHNLAKESMKFLTGAGVINAKVDGDIVEVELTTPQEIRAPFEAEGFTWYSYDTGVPHLVAIVTDLENFNIEISRKLRYGYNANINFMLIDDSLHVRTYERGVEDETLACGTGMAACFYAAYKLVMAKSHSRVIPKSKEELFFRIENNKIFFKGSVKNTFLATLN